MANERKGTVYTLPLGQQAEITYMTGHEEDLFTDEKKVKSGKAVEEVLQNCILTVDGEKTSSAKILGLQSPDRLFALVKVRQETYGDIVEYEATCQCKALNTGEIDLSELEVKEAPAEREFETTIGGKTVRFTWLDGTKEQKLAKLKTDVITNSMLLRIIEVEGVHPNGIKKWLQELPGKERLALRNAMNETDCGITTAVEVPCDECGRTLTVRAEAQQSFFFPSK